MALYGVDPFTASMMDLSQDDLVDWYNPENEVDPLGAARQAELAGSTYGGGGKSVRYSIALIVTHGGG